MPTLVEDKLTFEFPAGWNITKYDDWSYYRNQFMKVFSGRKAVDCLAMDPKAVCWLLEIKDYRQHPRTKTIDIVEEIAIKIVDTLAGVLAARFNANDENERSFAESVLKSSRIRVAFHLEQPAAHSKLFPRRYELPNIQQKLRQLVKAIDPHPKVVAIGSPGLPWNVRST
jgi:hypothetical protein